MFNLGLFELTLLLMIALIVLGPEQLLVMARTLGKWYAKFLQTKERLQQDVINELNLQETHAQLQAELAKIRQTEQSLQAQMHALQGQIHKNSQEIRQLAPAQPPTGTDNHRFSSNLNHAPNHHDLPTMPMNGRFFLLGDYDRHRRLPNAPYLPNRTADKLLHSLGDGNDN